MTEKSINNRVLQAKEKERRTVVRWYECPECGEESDEYTGSHAGETHECICGKQVKIYG